MDRRRFLVRSSRWFLTGGLLGTTGLLLKRRKVGDPDDCFVNPYCERCNSNKSCKVIAARIPEPNERQERK